MMAYDGYTSTQIANDRAWHENNHCTLDETFSKNAYYVDVILSNSTSYIIFAQEARRDDDRLFFQTTDMFSLRKLLLDGHYKNIFKLTDINFNSITDYSLLLDHSFKCQFKTPIEAEQFLFTLRLKYNINPRYITIKKSLYLMFKRYISTLIKK